MKKLLITVALISLMLPLAAFTGTVIETTGKAGTPKKCLLQKGIQQ